MITQFSLKYHLSSYVNAAITARIAHFPLNRPAGSTGEAAEWSFCVGARFGYCHRNDTNAADCSAAATADICQLQEASFKLQVWDHGGSGGGGMGLPFAF
ncbi:MAG: hypothetical protein H0X30_22585 [Anaerolineae bacterium]|nr:hypothetical protein [Anaerolineae bacterium]